MTDRRLHDLGLWADGDLSLGELTERHGEAVEGPAAIHRRLVRAAAQPVPDPEASWTSMRGRLVRTQLVRAPIGKRLTRAGRMGRPLLIALATLLLMGTALAAGFNPIRLITGQDRAGHHDGGKDHDSGGASGPDDRAGADRPDVDRGENRRHEERGSHDPARKSGGRGDGRGDGASGGDDDGTEPGDGQDDDQGDDTDDGGGDDRDDDSGNGSGDDDGDDSGNGSGDDDDNSGPGSGDDDDNSGPGSDDDDSSGPGSGDSGPGSDGE